MPDPDPLSFGIVTDCQFADADPDPPNFYRDATEKLRACIDIFNAHDLAFIVNLGDTIDRDLASFDTILPEFGSARAPVYHLLGNHDFAVAPEEKHRIPSLLEIPDPPYYRSFSFPGWRFLCLDGNQLSLAAHPPASPEFKRSTDYLKRLSASGAENAQYYNGGIGGNQLVWLDAQLSKADSAGERAIIFNHFPVFPASTHNLWDADSVLETLTRHPSALAHINGHRHQGAIATREGIHYLTARALLESPDAPTCAIAQIDATHLRLHGHGNQPSLDLIWKSKGDTRGT